MVSMVTTGRVGLLDVVVWGPLVVVVSSVTDVVSSSVAKISVVVGVGEVVVVVPVV